MTVGHGHHAADVIPSKLVVVVPWVDVVVDENGWPADDAYVETFWLPRIGPSAWLVLRRFAAWASENGQPIGVETTAMSLGVHPRVIERAIARLVEHKLARWHARPRPTPGRPSPPWTLEVRRVVPPLSRSQAARLPRMLSTAHAAWPQPPRRRRSHA